MIYQILTSPTELLFGYHGGKPRMIKEKEKKAFEISMDIPYGLTPEENYTCLLTLLLQP